MALPPKEHLDLGNTFLEVGQPKAEPLVIVQHCSVIDKRTPHPGETFHSFGSKLEHHKGVLVVLLTWLNSSYP
jgi:hypothetical protein